MLVKFIKFFLLIFLFFCQNTLYSKNTNNNQFKSKNLSSYFSALISFENDDNDSALKFFNSSKSLMDEHDIFLKNYVKSLIIEGKVLKAINQVKLNLNKKNSNFFEAQLLLSIDSIKRKDFKESKKYLIQISNFISNSPYEIAIYEALKSYTYLFEHKKKILNKKELSNLSFITEIFQTCYLDEMQTETLFVNLLNNNSIDYSRYTFFYINYLIEQNRYDDAKRLTNEIDVLNNNLLVLQAKNWIDTNNLKGFKKTFSCKNENDVLGEFFFLVSSLYSSQNDFEKSNFYLQIANFLNPEFNFNFSLMAENYFKNKNYIKTKEVLNYFNKNDDIYQWYAIKKKGQIIAQQENDEKSFDFIYKKFKKNEYDSVKEKFDIANIAKNFSKYDIAINYYNKVLTKIDQGSLTYADILYRRGSCYERVKNYLKADKDFLTSLNINPDDAYVLNYLAYSWLERDHKVDVAIQMLQKAYKIKKNDPYILDSVGWAYYLIGDFNKAEEFMKRAIMLMPNDPIVNDHYGDILWKLDRKIQAKYYWESVLNFDDTEKSMKEKIKIKILKDKKKI